MNSKTATQQASDLALEVFDAAIDRHIFGDSVFLNRLLASAPEDRRRLLRERIDRVKADLRAGEAKIWASHEPIQKH